MIDSPKPYPAYKDSSVPWLGKLPGHWKVLPNRALFSEVKERDHADDEMLSVTITHGIVNQKALLAGTSKKDSSNRDKSAYKLVQPGDIAYNKMRAWQGAVGMSSLRGIVSPAYVVMRLRECNNPRYFHYLYRTPLFAKEAERWSYGITSDMWSLRPEHFRLIYSSVPPTDEQSAIVRLLDYADRRIRRFILAKKKLISLLNEQKQSIIHQAVVRGLDPKVRLKPSGVEWIGEVPEHWEVLRLGQILIDGPRNGVSPPVVQEQSGVESFSISAVRGGKLDVQPHDLKYVNGAGLFSTYDLKRGDILLVRGNGNIKLVGKAGLVCDDMPNRIYPDILMRIRLSNAADPAYAVGLLNCRTIRDQIENAAKTTVGTFKVNNQHIRQLWLLLPPRDEQLAIIEDIEERTSGLSALVKRAEREVSLLSEYRTRLIADVVTGKLDVRQAAARLPNEVNKAEPIEDLDTVTDNEAEDEIAEVERVVESSEV